MSILSANQKTGKSLNLPISHTCNRACPWFDKGCYGQKGRMIWNPVTMANMARLNGWKATPEKFWADMADECKNLKHLRIFGVGDFPNKRFAWELVEFMKNNKQTKFWIASFKAGKLGWHDVVDAINALPNAIIRISDQEKTTDMKYTSSVTEGSASCPATMGKAKDCKECGYKCWSKRVKHVTYKKH